MSSRDPKPETPPEPPIHDPDQGRDAPIDEPRREVPAIDPRRPGAPRPVREPRYDPDQKEE